MLFGLFTEVETITSQVVSSFSMPDLRCNSTSKMLSDDSPEMLIITSAPFLAAEFSSDAFSVPVFLFLLSLCSYYFHVLLFYYFYPYFFVK